MSEEERLIVCGYCGNKTNCKVRAQYTLNETDGFNNYKTTWSILQCPACDHLILQQDYDTDSVFDNERELVGRRTLYPILKPYITNIPTSIQKEYEAALKVRNVSANACAVLARRTLEAIFMHEKAPGRTLAEKVNGLIKSERIPPLLADVAHLGRQIGNLGAHFDIGDATEEDVAIMLEFLETILEYLYIIPTKVATVKTRLEKLSRSGGASS